MLLSDEARCAGERSKINPSRPAAFCVPCTRRILPGDGVSVSRIEPAVVRVDGQFYCANRRFDGGNHESECAPTCQVLQPLDVGPADGGQDGADSAFRNAGVTGHGA